MSIEQPELKKVSLTVGIGMIIALLAFIMIGLGQGKLPTPVASSAAPTAFSSARAMEKLRMIAQRPHSIGTAENAAVRTYLVDELKALGLTPEIETGLGMMTSPPWNAIGRVHNILVRVPGRIPGKAVLLAAHYDSVPTGPGAADDGASVAAILETLRIVKASAPLQNDLICIFTDGEEVGLLGSQLFADEHPWAKDIGVALNFEYRGSSGPMLMFETSQGNGKLISAMATSVKHPVANSLMYEIYKLLPNGTDLSSFKRANIPSMNFAAIEQPTSYHMQLDRPESLNEGTLQHEGDIMLAMTNHFGNSSLNDLKAEDSIYFNAPGFGLVQYPVGWVMPLCGLVVIVFLGVLVAGVKSSEVRLGRTLFGALAFLLITIVLAVGCQILWRALGSVHPEYRMLADPYNSHWYLPAFVGLVIGLFVLMQSALKRRINPMEQGLGAMMCWVFLLIATSISIPGMTFLFTWPLLPILVVLGFLFSEKGRRLSVEAKAVLLLIGSAPGVILFAPTVRILFIGLSPQVSLAIGLFVALLMGIMAPFLAMLTRRFVLPLIPLTASIAFFAVGAFTANFDAEHPRPDNVLYALDGKSGNAFWMSSDQELDSWNKGFFPASATKRNVPEIFGPDTPAYWVGPAPQVPGLQAPSLEVLHDVTNGNARDLSIRVRSPRNAPSLNIKMEGTEVLSFQVQGKSFPKTLDPKWFLMTYGLSNEWLTVDLQVKPGKPFQIRVIDETYGLPQIGMPQRSAALTPNIYGSGTDTTQAVQVKNFN